MSGAVRPPSLTSPSRGEGIGSRLPPPLRGRDGEGGKGAGGKRPGVERARLLRRNQTPAEKRLWRSLRGNRLEGLCFRRQHPIGPYVVDFFCPAKKLVVEVDGYVHDTPDAAAKDEARTQWLQTRGYRVIRVRNTAIREDINIVLEAILAVAAQRPPSLTSPSRGEGIGSRLPPPLRGRDGEGGKL